MSSAATTQPITRRTRAPWTIELVGAGAAAITALVAWAALVPLGGVQLSVLMGAAVKQIGPLDVGITAFTAGLGGLFMLRVLERCTRSALTIWTWTAAVVLVLSYAGALTALSLSAALSLIALHSVVGAVVIAVGRRSRR